MEGRKKYPNFSRDSEAGQLLMEWWRQLQNRPGDRAELRRCRSISSVAMIPAFHQLYSKLRSEHSILPDALALTASLLSHVKADRPVKTLGSYLAMPKSKGGSAPLSNHRFRRLLRIHDKEKLLESMIRVIRMMDSAMPLCKLADTIYWWSDRKRKDLAFDYFE